MAFYPFNSETKFHGRILRQGIDQFRDGVAKLQRIKGILAQASNAQLVDLFGFADATAAGAAKDELVADIPSLSAAEQQMLDQFG